ncbi:Oidioi.mRNA.OKI2018_I69.chr2.g5230.t1.cds [Oikopleura dioica]|uniref:Oidioi.mRNA.OKI2018_I69.chr2.g5230.t1.cds n=1 Tax=Oikopleura dioica TaxID=34765 RepID=A0ABN7T5M8_OIKDI|nr:Oidioi.mRNA.OKI2018_I69.chr2.g5230.t1.cds [Oikopleura dioica]
MLVAISCGAAESERFIFLSLPDLLPLRKHPATLQKISPLEDVERKKLGIPLVMEVMGCFLYCSFESGQILELNENLTVSRGVQFGRKCQLLTASVCLENQKKIIFIGEADGKISKEGEDAKKRAWDLIKVSPGCMDTREDGKLLAVGFVTGQVALLTCKSLKPLSGK